MMIKHLEWDSSVFGVWSGLLDLSTAELFDDEPLAERVSCALGQAPASSFITVKIPAGCWALAKAVASAGGRMTDIAVTFRYVEGAAAARPDCRPDVQFEFCRSAAYEPFLPLAEAMDQSRFFRDPRISRDTALALWRQSIMNHCQGFADELLVGRAGSSCCGLTTLRFGDAGSVCLHIVGVLEQWRGQGIACRMLKCIAEKYGSSRKITVETQSTNNRAAAAYQRAGFYFDHCTCVFHCWR